MLGRDRMIDYEIYGKDGNIIEMSNPTPEYTIGQFFRLFSGGDFENMKYYCTQNCINDFFDENGVFGFSKAVLTKTYIDPLEYAKSSNGFNVIVTADVTQCNDLGGKVFGYKKTFCDK